MSVLNPEETLNRKKYRMKHRQQLSGDFEIMSRNVDGVTFRGTEGLCVALFGGDATDSGLVRLASNELLGLMHEKNSLSGVLFLCNSDPGDLSRELVCQLAEEGVSIRHCEDHRIEPENQVDALLDEFSRLRNKSRKQFLGLEPKL